MAAAEADEVARQATHSPAGGSDPGVVLSGMAAGERSALGMSEAAEVPEVGPLVQGWDSKP
jgi:hypothetical protein